MLTHLKNTLKKADSSRMDWERGYIYMDLRLKVSDHELAHGIIIELSDLPVEGCCAHVLKHVHKPKPLNPKP